MGQQRPPGEGVIVLRAVDAGYPGEPVLHDITLAIAAGSLVSLVGPNGAGKSTLLKVIAGLLPPLAGEVRVLAADPRSIRPRLAYVPQRTAVDWHFPLTVRQVVMMGRQGWIGIGRCASPNDRAVVEAALGQTGLTELGERQIGRLSGGQQQRAFLARALAQEAEVLLLDEPFSGVDAVTEEMVVDLLEQLRAAGKTIMVSTHDLGRALAPFDHILMLNHHVMAYGAPSEVFTAEALRRTYGRRLVVLPQGEGLVVGGAAARDERFELGDMSLILPDPHSRISDLQSRTGGADRNDA